MNKKSIKRNYVYNLIYQISAIIIPIITIPYISRVLGATNIGIYGYTISISAYFILIGSLGISLYGQREIAYNQADKKMYSQKFWEIFLLKLSTMLVSILVFYLLFVKGKNPYAIYYKILLVELFASVLDISWFFQGIEEFGKTVSRNLLIRILSLICIFIFVKTKNDLYIYFVIYVASTLIGNLTLWLFVPKYIERISFRKINVFSHMKKTFMLFIPQAAIQIYTVLDRTMIGIIISDKAEVGFYTQGERIIKLLLTIITAMGTVMLPRIASKFAEDDNKAIKKYIYKSFNLVFILAFPLVFGLIAVSKSFVPIFFGPGYDKVVPIMMILSIIILFVGVSNVIGMQYLLPTKRQKEYTISVICGAVVNLLINLVLISKYGAIGASLATIIAELVVTLVQISFVRKNLELKKILFLTKDYCIASVIMFVICIVISYFIESNMMSLLIQIVVGGCSYLLILLIMKNEFLLEIKNILMRNIIKK